MPATNPINGLPYPLDTDAPDVPADMQALVAAMAANGLPAKVAVGRVAVTATGSTSGTAAVTFPASFFDSAPQVWVQAVATGVWRAHVATTPSTSGFTAGINANSAGTATVNVEWLAIQKTL